MLRVRPSAVPALILPKATRARLLGISSLTTLSGALMTAPRPSLAALNAEIERLDKK